MDRVNSLKTARMTVDLTALDAGAGAAKLELGTAAMAATLVSITLDDPAGTVAGTPAALTLGGMPRTGNATATGKIVAGRTRDSNNNDVHTGLTVGLNSTVAPAWVGSTAYTAGQYRTNGAQQYKCVTGGTSAASGGPTGTGAGITDGTAVWDWYSPANADLQLAALEITDVGQTVQIDSAVFTHA